MKKLLMVVAASVLSMSTAFAQGAIATVNMQEIMMNAPQMKTINAQLKKQFSTRKESILSQVKGLQANIENLRKNASVLPAAKVNALKDTIGRQEGMLRNEQMQYQRDLVSSQNQLMHSFLAKVKSAVAQIASKEKLGFVMSSNTLLYADDKTDITSKVLSELK